MIDSRKSFTGALLEEAKKDKDLVVVTTDARGSVTLNEFADTLPEQFVECGIAEQNAVGIAAGLSHSGKNVVCCGPACFYVARALEQIKVDVAYSRNPVKIFGVSGGFAYGALGSTHHSLHDIAVLRAFPGMNIFIPSDGHMAAKAARTLMGSPEPIYIRVGRGATGEVYADDNCDCTPGKANRLREGNDLCILATGEAVCQAVGASDLLRAKGINARVLDCSWIKPFDTDELELAAKETGCLVTVEEHSVNGGLGSVVTESLSEHPVPVRIIAVPDENAAHGTSAELYKRYGMDAEGVARSAEEFFHNIKG